MNQRSSQALLFITLAMGSVPTMAQTAYKCGSSYSQSPCPGGMAIDASDSRSPNQKAQADAATVRDARAGRTLEKDRLKQESTAIAGNPVAEKAGVAPAPKGKSHVKKKDRKPEFFTAREPGSKKANKKTSKPVNGSASPAVAAPST